MSTDPGRFIETMTFWRKRFLESANLPIVGATEADLNSIKAPACMIAGNDIIHTPGTARKAAKLIRNSELHEDVVSKRPDDDLLEEWDRKEWRDAEGTIARIFADFLSRTEKESR
jgi:hypothetical protein